MARYKQIDELFLRDKAARSYPDAVGRFLSVLPRTDHATREEIVPLPVPTTRHLLTALLLAALAVIGVIKGLHRNQAATDDVLDAVEVAQADAERILASVVCLLPERTRKKTLGSAVDTLYERTADAITASEVQRVTRSIARHMLTTAGRTHAYNAQRDARPSLFLRFGVGLAISISVISGLTGLGGVLGFLAAVDLFKVSPGLAFGVGCIVTVLAYLAIRSLYIVTIASLPKGKRQQQSARRRKVN